MQITAKTWNEYITRLSRLNQKAGQLMRQYIDTHGTGDADALITYAAALVTKYGEGSAELACQMYDALAEAANAGVPAAEPAVPADYGEVARMVNATKNQNPANLPNGVSRLVKRAGADTTLKNAVRDGAEWAWVPHGDTCPFCITLASNGWQKASSKVLKGGHAEHIHANCDCEFAIRFDHNTTVAGYDPEKYLAQYNAAGGDINKMRRIDYRHICAKPCGRASYRVCIHWRRAWCVQNVDRAWCSFGSRCVCHYQCGHGHHQCDLGGCSLWRGNRCAWGACDGGNWCPVCTCCRVHLPVEHLRTVQAVLD